MITRINTYSQSSKLPSKLPVVVSTTANITLSGTQTIDGISVVSGNRVLVKNQSTGSQNGIYICGSSTWVRSIDMSSSEDLLKGITIFINSGTANGGKMYVLTSSDPLTLGSSNLVFSQVSGGSGSNTGSITIELYNGGSDLTTGIKDTPVLVPYNGTVTGWEIMAYNSSNTLLSTSCVIDILSDTFANLPLIGSDSIAGSEKPTLSSTSTASDNTITTWSSIILNKYIQAEIESISAGVAKVVVSIKVTKT